LINKSARCIEAGLELCFHCEAEQYKSCDFVYEKYILSKLDDVKIIKYYLDTIKRFGEYNAYYIFNAIKMYRPHLIEKLDKLKLLI